jgi:hypothetical protein
LDFGNDKDLAATELRQTPDATADVNEQAGIAQHLKLLPDFIADVPGVLTHSRPLARPSRAFIFDRIPFAASQAAQVSGWSFSSSRVKA